METNDTLVHMLTGSLLSNYFMNIFRHQPFHMHWPLSDMALLFNIIKYITLCCIFPVPGIYS